MTKPARALTLALMIAGSAVAAPATAAPAEAPPVGVVGLCVRWGVDPLRIADAIVVESSGNLEVDALASAAVRSAAIPKPEDDTGGWRALSMGFGGVEPPASPPDCGSLQDVSAEPATPAPAPAPEGLMAT
jgi:hypothetical protein